jgi:hypothetical protein
MGREHGNTLLFLGPLQVKNYLDLWRFGEIPAEAPKGLGQGVVSGFHFGQQHRPAVDYGQEIHLIAVPVTQIM